MDKYYTPELNEFHVGFECEWQCKIRNETWSKQICDTDLINIAYDAIEHADEEEPFEEQFRVKYLDKEDIESLGFISSNVRDVLKEEAEFIKGFKKDTYILYIQEDKKLVIYNQKEYDISNKITGNWTEEILFKGYIKNKSKLIKLLKQLQIG